MENINISGESLLISGNWDWQANKLRAKFPQLTTEDLKYETGKEDELLTRLASRLMKSREEVTRLIRKGKAHRLHGAYEM